MDHTITLGSTGIVAQRNGFGALPIQRDDKDTAVRLLRKACEHGINYYDTARGYTDSEEKLGLAFGDMGVRDKIYIATKTHAKDVAGFWSDLETSLKMLRTDYIDVYQFHNPKQVFRPGDGTGMYEAALEAKAKGLIRHIGFTNHSLERAAECIASGLYETLQFPFSYLSGEPEMQLVRACREKHMGFIAMKGLAGGLLTNARACHAFMAEYPNVVPIWGIQYEHELDEWLAVSEEDPRLDDELRAAIEKDRAELCGSFCRGCGYCEPCPAGIEIHTCARMNMLLRRSPWRPLLSPPVREKMQQIRECLHCGSCASKCPYGLDAAELMPRMLEDYEAFYAEHKAEL